MKYRTWVLVLLQTIFLASQAGFQKNLNDASNFDIWGLDSFEADYLFLFALNL